MLKERRNRLLVLMGAAIIAILILAAGLSNLELNPGQPLPGAMPSEGSNVEPAGEGGDIILVALRFFLIFMGLLFPFGVLYLIVSPEARKQVLRALASLIWIPALYVAIRARPELFNLEDVEPPNMAAPGGGTGFGSPTEFTAAPSPALVLVMTIVFALVLALLVVGTSWTIWNRRRRTKKRPLDQLAEDAQQAIDSLQAGADMKDVVLRCYFDMSQALREERDIQRDKAMTPREFEARLEEAGLPPEHVRQLTRLFEGVRYGARSPSKEEQQQAIACLTAIVDACRSPV